MILRRIYSMFLTAIVTATAVNAEKLVILHTNDTHSHIDPVPSDNLGGVLRRKVLIDSVRSVQPNVLLVDAGDIVQGTLFFHLYKGAVEQRMLNELGYDIQILGNHEFDNGTDALARMYADARPVRIASNYDFTGSALEPMFVPYLIKEIAGKRFGFMAININPTGMIADGNYDGVSYLDWRTVADSTARYLKHNEMADAVIALTHIGFERAETDTTTFSDTDLATSSHDIDIIIGGHSHTALPSGRLIDNADGRPVLVAQAGGYGRYLGEITIDTDSLQSPRARLIRVDSRLETCTDQALASVIADYRKGIDNLYHIEVGNAARFLNNREPALMNFAADFVADRGRLLAPGVELAITNKGGLRTSLPKGTVSEGMIIDLMPFANRITVIDIKGNDLRDALDVMATRGGDAVSKEVMAEFNPDSGKCTSITIDGKPLDPSKTYRIATIDYLANGGDYMVPLTRGSVIAQSRSLAYEDMLDYLKSDTMKGLDIDGSDIPRMRPATNSIKQH